MVGKPLASVWFAHPELQAMAGVLGVSVVESVSTVGKAMLTHFRCKLTVYSHNQLYGRWYVVSQDKHPKTQRQLRWAIYGKERSALLYSASDISVWATERIHEHPFVSKAGMDVLAQNPSNTDLVAYFRAFGSQRRALGALLLDQGFLAGVGNYLRSEILFVARLSPRRNLQSLSNAELDRLASAVRTMMCRAYQTGGVTNAPDRVLALKAQGAPRSRYRHFVFARRNAPCYACQSKIEQFDVAGRRLYISRCCQSEV